MSELRPCPFCGNPMNGYPDYTIRFKRDRKKIFGVYHEICILHCTKCTCTLEQAGATVILTRSDENGIYDLDKNTLREKKVSDIKNRVKIGNGSGADIFVSIHLIIFLFESIQKE